MSPSADEVAPAGPRRRRGGLAWLGGSVVAVCLLAVLSRYVDRPVDALAMVQALVPLFALAGIIVGSLTLAVTRRLVVGVLTGCLLVITVALAVPTLQSRAAAPADTDVVVMSSNLYFGEGDATAVLDAVGRHKVDVLVLVEVTDAALTRLEAAGMDAILPNQIGVPRDGAQGTVIRSRWPMALLDTVGSFPRLHAEPSVRVIVPGGKALTLRAVHVLAPTSGEADAWRRGLADLRTWADAQPSDAAVVMAGDFNASADHPGLRELSATFLDATRSVGATWVATWPTGLVIPPVIHIDHILIRGLSVVDAGTETIPGSDHAAVWARLSVTTPSQGTPGS